MRSPSPTRLMVAAIAVSALLFAGCGSSDDSTTTTSTSTTPGATTSTTESAPLGARATQCDIPTGKTKSITATGASCAEGKKIVAGWKSTPSCAPPPGASRYSCKVDGMTCLGNRIGQGVGVACAETGRSFAFVIKLG